MKQTAQRVSWTRAHKASCTQLDSRASEFQAHLTKQANVSTDNPKRRSRKRCTNPQCKSPKPRDMTEYKVGLWLLKIECGRLEVERTHKQNWARKCSFQFHEQNTYKLTQKKEAINAGGKR